MEQYQASLASAHSNRSGCLTLLLCALNKHTYGLKNTYRLSHMATRRVRQTVSC